VNYRGTIGFDTLAFEQGHLEIARVLVEAGAKKHQPRTDGFTALHLAACKGRLDIVQLLIEPSADTDITMDHVSTALLVGGFKWFQTCFFFHFIYGILWDVILPIDFHIFQDGYCMLLHHQPVQIWRSGQHGLAEKKNNAAGCAARSICTWRS